MAFCEQCGGIVGENAKFCRNCGKRVEGIGSYIPVRTNRPQVETVEEQRKTEIPLVKQVDWKAMRQNGLSIGKQWWTVGSKWTKQKTSALWNWKWGKVVISAVALIVIAVLVLPHVGNRVIGKCSYCYSPVKASEMGRCPSCDRPFGNMVPILSVDGTKIVYEGEKAETGEEKPQNEKKTTFNDVAGMTDKLFDEEDEFIPDYRPGYENTNGTFGSNWANGGNIAEQDGWIYYCFWGSLYKMPIGGTEQDVVKIFDKEVESVNVVGDWVYCCCYDYEGSDDCLIRIRTDGAVVEKLDTVYGVDVIVMDGYAYYIVGDRVSASKRETIMYRLDIESLEKEAFLHEHEVGSSFGIENYTGTAITIWYDGGEAVVRTTGEVIFESDVDESEVRWNQDGKPAWLELSDTEEVPKGGWSADYYFHVEKRGDYEYDDCRFGPVDNVSSLYLANFDQYLILSAYEMFDGSYLYDAHTGEMTKINDDNMANVQYAGGYIYYSTDISRAPRYRCKLDGSDWSEIDWMCP